MRAAALAAVLLAWGCAAVCFNDCSGHGECRGYECWCEPGWDGEDCRHPVAAVNGTARRPLSVGHANVTSMHSITKLARRYPLLMVGLSSRSCMACLAVEPEYAALAPFLRGSGGKLVRVDGDRHYEVARALRAPSLPFTVFFVDGKRFPFHGPHRSRELRAFAEKLRGPPVHMLSSATAVDAALSPGQPSWAGYSMSSHYVTVVGIFQGDGGDEGEDAEWEDFLEAADRLRYMRDVYFAATKDPDLTEFALSAAGSRAAPSAVGSFHRSVQRLDELFAGADGEDGEGDLTHWIQRKSVRVVDELDATTFPRYEALRLPMAILFLDLSQREGNYLGHTQGIANTDLVVAAERAAHGTHGRLAVVFCDGAQYAAKMRALGIMGGKRSLPAMAINAIGERVPALGGSQARDEASMRAYIHSFLGDRLPREVAGASPAKESRDSPAAGDGVRPSGSPVTLVPGVAETYDGEAALVPVSARNVSEVVGEEGVDVFLVLHRRDCERSANMAPYIKRVARRLQALAPQSARVVHMDVTDEPPPLTAVDGASAPSLTAFPAYRKQPPHPVYTGVTKVLPMLRWAAATADVPFSLPELPQFDDTERAAYKAQVRARERARAEGKSAFDLADVEREQAAEERSREAALQAAARDQV